MTVIWGLEIAFPASICRQNDRVIKKGNRRKSDDFEPIFAEIGKVETQSGVFIRFCWGGGCIG